MVKFLSKLIKNDLFRPENDRYCPLAMDATSKLVRLSMMFYRKNTTLFFENFTKNSPECSKRVIFVGFMMFFAKLAIHIVL